MELKSSPDISVYFIFMYSPNINRFQLARLSSHVARVVCQCPNLTRRRADQLIAEYSWSLTFAVRDASRGSPIHSRVESLDWIFSELSRNCRARQPTFPRLFPADAQRASPKITAVRGLDFIPAFIAESCLRVRDLCRSSKIEGVLATALVARIHEEEPARRASAIFTHGASRIDSWRTCDSIVSCPRYSRSLGGGSSPGRTSSRACSSRSSSSCARVTCRRGDASPTDRFRKASPSTGWSSWFWAARTTWSAVTPSGRPGWPNMTRTPRWGTSSSSAPRTSCRSRGTPCARRRRSSTTCCCCPGCRTLTACWRRRSSTLWKRFTSTTTSTTCWNATTTLTYWCTGSWRSWTGGRARVPGGSSTGASSTGGRRWRGAVPGRIPTGSCAIIISLTLWAADMSCPTISSSSSPATRTSSSMRIV